MPLIVWEWLSPWYCSGSDFLAIGFHVGSPFFPGWQPDTSKVGLPTAAATLLVSSASHASIWPTMFGLLGMQFGNWCS